MTQKVENFNKGCSFCDMSNHRRISKRVVPHSKIVNIFSKESHAPKEKEQLFIVM
jgi:hypothetical protein